MLVVNDVRSVISRTRIDHLLVKILIMNLFIVTITALIISKHDVNGLRPSRRRPPSSTETISRDEKSWPISNMKTENMTKFLGDMEEGNCMLGYEMVSIRGKLPDNDHSSYYPTCVKVLRCQGCCMGNRRCMPINSSYKSFKINKLDKTGYKEVFVREDARCSCGCKIQRQQCSFDNALYDEMKCTCGCSNTEEKSKCREKIETHVWKPSTCKCRCIEKKHCSSGEIWDEESCSCNPEYEVEFHWNSLD